MCGLVGCAGDLDLKSDKTIRALLILDTIRGEDSTGIAAIPKYGDTVVVKSVGPAHELFSLKKYDDVIKKMNRVVIGHNRLATVGVVSRKTAHPFDFNTLVGVHNGTLKNKHRLADSADFVVDSENLYHHIEKHGLKDAINIVEGAYALVWWDKNGEILNFLRNDERPLYYAFSKDNKQMYWASEKWMLSVACGRNGVDLQDILEVEEDMHYSFAIDNKGAISKPRVSLCKQPEYVQNLQQQQGWYHGGNRHSFTNKQQQQTPAVAKSVVIPFNQSSEKKKHSFRTRYQRLFGKAESSS